MKSSEILPIVQVLYVYAWLLIRKFLIFVRPLLQLQSMSQYKNADVGNSTKDHCCHDSGNLEKSGKNLSGKTWKVREFILPKNYFFMIFQDSCPSNNFLEN